MNNLDLGDELGNEGYGMHCLKVVEKRKAQKAKLKEELMRVAWHPSRWWDSCVPENEKKETKKLWS